jgi:hypothetical protein
VESQEREDGWREGIGDAGVVNASIAGDKKAMKRKSKEREE